jgi:hypothetical protein
MGFQEEDRKFLHDIATPLTIMKMLSKGILSEIEGEKEPSSPEKQLARIQRVIDQIIVIENLHADQRARISARVYPEGL